MRKEEQDNTKKISQPLGQYQQFSYRKVMPHVDFLRCQFSRNFIKLIELEILQKKYRMANNSLFLFSM